MEHTNDKIFKTVDEQIALLISRGMDIFTADRKSTAVIADFQHQLSARAKDPSISHYLVTYGYVPLWVLSCVNHKKLSPLSLGREGDYLLSLNLPEQVATPTCQLSC